MLIFAGAKYVHNVSKAQAVEITIHGIYQIFAQRLHQLRMIHLDEYRKRHGRRLT